MTLRHLFAALIIALIPTVALADTKAEIKAKKAAQIEQAIDVAMKTIPVTGDAIVPIRACFTDFLNLMPASEIRRLADANYDAPPEMYADWAARFPEVGPKAADCSEMVRQAVAEQSVPAASNTDQVTPATSPSGRNIEFNLVGQGITMINPEGSVSLGNFGGGVDYKDGKLTIGNQPVILPDFKTLLAITIQSDGTYKISADPAP